MLLRYPVYKNNAKGITPSTVTSINGFKTADNKNKLVWTKVDNARRYQIWRKADTNAWRIEDIVVETDLETYRSPLTFVSIITSQSSISFS